ncbi:hypothetical protein EVAR_28669_1 [Eumeta japonica]|uniref:Uncharacterized protein n=1 Tax=Eumeta variegata TaxID=151549 RepID=A0A4C1V666_EUMVA|nr:hypothetical protein EVAR_28669_1 [Eumeta japonica]
MRIFLDIEISGTNSTPASIVCDGFSRVRKQGLDLEAILISLMTEASTCHRTRRRPRPPEVGAEEAGLL